MWVTHQADVGLLRVQPVKFQIDTTTPVNIPQYPIKPEASVGIKDTIDGLLEAGVIYPTTSPWNTPVLPVLKADGQSYRMAHDLRSINVRVLEPPQAVPNPAAALSLVIPEHQWFTVIDLANAFFCLPLSEELQPIFAFTYSGQQYTYNRMPQGFSLTPGIFNSILKQCLQESPPLPDKTLLVQYVDDLLIASHTREQCLEASLALLQYLGKIGFLVKKTKIQLVRPRVQFLGSVISGRGSEMTASRRQTILVHKQPVTVRDLQAFLGLINFSRHLIPDYASRTASLRDVMQNAGTHRPRAKLTWTEQVLTDFQEIKQSLAHAAALAKPDYAAPFWLDVSIADNGRMANACLYQQRQGEKHRDGCSETSAFCEH
ncbi:unnamed protein product [Tetraodon nigroviridis]|uniref:ribonuclease H n=1 Tax=Tetraodon nigroviridis TaxID=99883 RepID=Q4T1B9_TETNG|nr:unnamed protein product [Tetraodon nigroviridis]